MFSVIALTVGGFAIPTSQLSGICTITRRENESSTLDITIRPTAGVQDIDYWRGKAVTLDVDGIRAFTGKVDEPEIDLVYKKINLSCTDTRRETLNTDLAATIDTYGSWSSAIFDEPENVIDELDQRLQTDTLAADILPSGVSSVTSMTPKAVPDFTLTNADVYRRKPTTSPTSRARLTNRVDLTFKYRYTRKRHRDREFKIQDSDFCTIIETTGVFTLKRDFLNYSQSMDWIIDESTYVFEDLPAPGIISYCAVASFNWIHDYTAATSLTYNATTRFGQSITEQFNITVTAPQSITQYGLINWAQSNGISFDYDAREWEQYTEYSAPTGGTADANDYYIDEEGVIADFENAVLTAINIAKTKILKSHRDTQTNFEIDLNLNLNLTHTIQLNSNPVVAKGKVTYLNHTLNFSSKKGNTEVEISQSTAQGTQIEDAIIVPARPAAPVVADAFVEPEVMLIADGNVVTPTIDATSRDEQIVAQAVTYNIEIQNDVHTVTF